MPTAELPFGNPVYRNVNGVELTDESSRLVNGYLDERGASVKRGGLENYLTLTTSPIRGLYWWDYESRALAYSNQSIYKLSYSPGSGMTGSLAGSLMTGSAKRAIFASMETLAGLRYAFCADGGNLLIIKSDGNVITNQYFANSIPTTGNTDVVNISHVGILDGYVLACKSGTQFFYWSKFDSPLVWTGSTSGYSQVMGSSDVLVAMHIVNREILFFGKNSVEIWEDNGETPFERIPGGFINVGCGAAYSIIETEQGVYWLDDNRRFVRLYGGNISKVSTPYDNELFTYSKLDDCLGDLIVVEGKTFLVWTFPTANKTLVCNVTFPDKPTWSEFGTWKSDAYEFESWPGNCYIYSPLWGLALVGYKKSGDICVLRNGYYYDHDRNASGDAITQTIRFCRTTGHINHGSGKRKLNQDVRLRVRRGEVSDAAVESRFAINLRYRDANRSNWSNDIFIPIGTSKDRWASHYFTADNPIAGIEPTEMEISLKRNGIYSSRQWEVSSDSPCPLTFCQSEEDFEWLA